MTRWLLGILVAAGLGAAGACGLRLPAEVQVTEGFAAPGTPYGDALAARTRYAELYQGLDTVAKGWATWRTPDLRAALAEASVRAYHLEGDAAERLRREARTAAEGPWEFHVAVYMPKKQWNDLEATESLWRARVELPGGGRLAPLEVRALVKTDKNPVQYPYVNPWTREYTLVFPAPEDGAQTAALALAGPLGTLRFAF